MERKTKLADHSDSYKRKNTVVEKRALRAHRRSIEWKHQRTETVNKRRNLGNLTPLKEADSTLEEKTVGPPQKKKVDAAASRSQMLQKWKEEKALKKKLDSQQKAKKMPFKVTHTKPSPAPFVFSVQPKNVEKQAPARRCTRSMVDQKAELPASRTTRRPTSVEPASRTTRRPTSVEPASRTTRRPTSVEPAHKVQKPAKPSHQPAKAPDAADKMLTRPRPTAASKPTQPPTRMTRSSAAKTVTARPTATKPPAQKPKKTVKKPDLAPVDTKHINYKRGEVSFAPSNFKFSVPTEVQSIVFTPLSPSSTASFLFPDQTHTATYNDKRCSTPKVPKEPHLPSPSTSTIQIAMSSENSSDEENKEKRSESSRRKSTRKAVPTPAENKTGTESSSDDYKKEERSQGGRRKSTRKATTADINTENETAVKDQKKMDTSVRRTRGRSATSGDSSAESDAKEISSRGAARNRSRGRASRSMIAATNTSGDHTENEGKPVAASRTRSRSKSTSADSGSDKGDVKTASDKLPVSEKDTRGVSDSDSTTEAAATDNPEKLVASTTGKLTRTRGRSLAVDSDSSDGGKPVAVRNTPAARRRTRASYAPSSDAAAATDDDDERNASQPTETQVVASTSRIDPPMAVEAERETEIEDLSIAKLDTSVKEDVMIGDPGSQTPAPAAETSTHKTPSNVRRKSALESRSATKAELSASAKPDELNVETPKPSGSGSSEGFSTPAPRDKATEDDEQARLMQSTRSETAIFRTPASIVRTRRKVRVKSLSEPQKRFRTPRQHRNSLFLRTLSPEEGVEFLRHSPMVEMTRRTPKSQRSPVAPLNFDPLPTFDDIDDIVPSRNETAKPADSTSTQDDANNATVRVDGDAPSSTGVPVVSSEIPAVSSEVPAASSEAPVASSAVEASCLSGPQSPGFPAPDSTVPDTVLDNDQNMTEANDNPVPDPVGGEATEHNVPYFRNILVTETERLNILCDKWNQIQDESSAIPDDVNGQIRTTVGQAHLLMRQRFKQFSGLVDDCEFHTGEKVTTCTDLQGFWDMIYFQVEDVDNKFTGLDKLKDLNWVIEKPNVPQKKKIVKKKIVKPGSKASAPARSKFSQFRTQMKQQKQKDETKTFEAGFFHVSSPVNSPEPNAHTGTPSQILEKRLSSKHNSNTNSPMLKSVLRKEARKSVATQLMIASQQLSSSSSSTESEPEAPRSHKRKMSLSSPVGSHKKVKKQDASPMLVDISSSTSNSDEHTTGQGRSRRSSVKRSARLQSKMVSFCETESTSTTKTSTGGGDDFLKYLIPLNTITPDNMNTNSEVCGTEDAEMDAPMKRDLLSEFDQESPDSAASTSIFSPWRKSTVGFGPLKECSPKIVKRTPRRSSRRLEQKENVSFSLVSEDTADVDSPSTSFAKLRVNQTPGLDGSMKTVSVFTPDVNMDSGESLSEAGSSSSNLMSFSPFTAPTVQSSIFGSGRSTPSSNRTRRSKRVSLL